MYARKVCVCAFYVWFVCGLVCDVCMYVWYVCALLMYVDYARNVCWLCIYVSYVKHMYDTNVCAYAMCDKLFM